MGKKILTQDERVLKFFFDKSAETEFKLVRRGAKVSALIENHENDTFSFIEVNLKNGERWTMRHDILTDKYTFAHCGCDGEDMQTSIENSPAVAPIDGDVVDFYQSQAAIDAINAIDRELKTVISSFCRIGYEFIKVRDDELYRFYDCKNVSEFGAKHFGLKKASVYNYINVCEKFSVPDECGEPTAEIAEAFREYSFSQLCEMLRLNTDTIALCSSSMTCKEIRALGSAALENGSDEIESEKTEAEYHTDYINLFSRVITPDLLSDVITMLRENMGRVINIEVGMSYHNGVLMPAESV